MPSCGTPLTPASGTEFQALVDDIAAGANGNAGDNIFYLDQIALAFKPVFDARRVSGTFPGQILEGWLSDKAITGSDGITITSGTNTIAATGFHTEFVAASGSLQSQISSFSPVPKALIGDNFVTVTSGTNKDNLYTKAIVAGSNVTVSSGTHTVTIAASTAPPNALIGDNFLTVSSGTNQDNLYTKAIVAGTNVVVSSGSNSVTIHSATPSAVVGGNNITVTSGSNTTTVTATGVLSTYGGDQAISNGGLTISGSPVLTTASTISIPDGSAGSPGLPFASDSDTGIFRSEANGFSITASGSERVRINRDGLEVISGQFRYRDGTVDAPAIVQDNAGHGIYRGTGNSLAFAVPAGTLRAAISGSTNAGLGVSGDFTVTGDIAGGFPNGSPSAPGMFFTADPDVGMWRRTTNELGLVASGTEWLLVAHKLVEVANDARLHLQDGAEFSATRPALSFDSDDDTGFYRPSPNNLAFVTGGGERLRVSSSGIGVIGDYEGSGNVSASGNATFHGNFEASKSSLQGGAGYTVLLEKDVITPVQVNLGDPASPEFSLRIVKFGSSSLQFTNGDGSIVFFRFDSTSSFVPEFPLGATVSGAPLRPVRGEWDFNNVSISNTSSETDLVNISVPSGRMGTSRSLKFDFRGTYFNDSGSSRTFILKIYWGGNLVYEDTSASYAQTATVKPWRLWGSLSNLGSASSQFLSAFMNLTSSTVLPDTGYGALSASSQLFSIASAGTLSANTASAQNFRITIQHSAADANLTLSMLKGRIWIED